MIRMLKKLLKGKVDPEKKTITMEVAAETHERIMREYREQAAQLSLDAQRYQLMQQQQQALGQQNIQNQGGLFGINQGQQTLKDYEQQRYAQQQQAAQGLRGNYNQAEYDYYNRIMGNKREVRLVDKRGFAKMIPAHHAHGHEIRIAEISEAHAKLCDSQGIDIDPTFHTVYKYYQTDRKTGIAEYHEISRGEEAEKVIRVIEEKTAAQSPKSANQQVPNVKGSFYP